MRSIGLRLTHSKYAHVEARLLLLAVVGLSGCAGGSSSLQSAWQQSPHPSFSKILIVGLSTDFDQRCSFEFSLASQFSGGTTQPIVSCNWMTPKEPLTRANIERVVATTHADAVLTTAVVTVQLSGKMNAGTPYYQVTGVGYVTGPVGAYGVPVAFLQLETSPSVPDISGDIHLVTKLFDTSDATLVYSVDTQAKSNNIQSSAVAMDTVTELIAGRLRRDGVLH
jgi:hypothetical protein